MASWKSILKSAVYVLAGALAYAALNWIPVLGPLSLGIFVGYGVGGGFGRGFRHGAASAVLGTLIVAYLFLQGGVLEPIASNRLLTVFILWVLLVWNCVGIFAAAMGGGAGAVGKDLKTLIPREIRDMLSARKEKPAQDYMICQACGQGNVASATTCISCGHALK